MAPMKNVMTRGIVGAVILSAPFVLSACVMEQTVTDGSGEVIYQKPVVESPFESEQQKEAEVDKRERELGW